jgi:hypothetical protein
MAGVCAAASGGVAIALTISQKTGEAIAQSFNKRKVFT